MKHPSIFYFLTVVVAALTIGSVLRMGQPREDFPQRWPACETRSPSQVTRSEFDKVLPATVRGNHHEPHKSPATGSDGCPP
jgi:hypothetical protein